MLNLSIIDEAEELLDKGILSKQERLQVKRRLTDYRDAIDMSAGLNEDRSKHWLQVAENRLKELSKYLYALKKHWKEIAEAKREIDDSK